MDAPSPLDALIRAERTLSEPERIRQLQDRLRDLDSLTQLTAKKMSDAVREIFAVERRLSELKQELAVSRHEMVRHEAKGKGVDQTNDAAMETWLGELTRLTGRDDRLKAEKLRLLNEKLASEQILHRLEDLDARLKRARNAVNTEIELRKQRLELSPFDREAREQLTTQLARHRRDQSMFYLTLDDRSISTPAIRCFQSEAVALAARAASGYDDLVLRETKHIGPYPISCVPHEVTGRTYLCVGRAIRIDGDDAYKAEILRHLHTISQTKSGQMLLAALENDAKGHILYIGPLKPGDETSCGPRTPADWRHVQLRGNPIMNGYGKPITLSNAATDAAFGLDATCTGEGTNMVVAYPLGAVIPNAADPGRPLPTDAVLFHEMLHGLHGMRGEQDLSPRANYTTEEEFRTIWAGVPCERTYLHDRGYPWCRDNHGVHFRAHPAQS